MTPEAPAVTPSTESAPVPNKLLELSSLSPEQRQTWRETGELPQKQASAPASDSAAPDSAPDGKASKSSDTRPDSEPGKSAQSPHRKTKEDTERRFQELLDRMKKAEERAEAAERRAQQPDQRDGKRDSQPAPAKAELKQPPALKTFLESYFADNKKASYEEGVEAWQNAREAWKDQENEKKLTQSLAADRQQRAQETTAKELQSKVQDATERYGKEEAGKIFPALEAIITDKDIPPVVKTMLDRSDVLVDLMYTLASDATEFDGFLKLARTDPGAALEKVITVQSLVREQLKTNARKPATDRGSDGKFQKAPSTETDESGKGSEADEGVAPPQSRAPRPPVEVGGRSTAPADDAGAAVKANDFRRAKAAFTREYAAGHKL